MHCNRNLLLAGTIAAILFAAGPVRSEVSWAVAEREDAQIESLISKLLPYVEDLPGADDAEGVVLFRQSLYDVEESRSRFCANLVLQVRDPASVPERLRSPWLAPGVTLEGQFAVVVRGGELRRLGEEAMRFEEGREEIGRARCHFEWGELRADDILVWSVVGAVQGPVSSMEVPAADIYPTVISNLTIHGNGRYVYDVRAVGVEPSEVTTKKSDLVEGEPSVWKASINARAAVADVPAGPPYPESVPHIAAHLERVWLRPPDGAPVAAQWVPTDGWNQAALIMEQLFEAAAEEKGNLDVVVSALTTGKTTELAKEEAIHAYVRDSIRPLEGPGFVDTGVRSVAEVLSTKEATEAEKIALMTAMLRHAGLTATIAAVRAPEFGGLDRKEPSLFQFTDFLVRAGGDEGRYYAPQCAECTAPAYPSDWVGLEVFSAPVDLLKTAEAKSAEWRRDAMATGSFNVAAMRMKMEKENWHRFETLGR